jgi:adenosylcobinamide-GDP ribazoletransferase
MSTITDEQRAKPKEGWRGWLADGVQMLRFYSRLPAPVLPFEGDPHRIPDFRRAPRALPLAGLAIALPAALALIVLHGLGLSPLLSAGLTLAVLVASTGAFHEDGLADCADGMGAATTERRLDIMKDSRIGTFGGAALVLSLLLRAVALGESIAALGALPTAGLLLAISAASRSLGLLPLALLPPARPGGFSAGVGRPTPGTMATGLGLAAALLLLAWQGAGLPLAGLAAALTLAAAMALMVCALARRLLGGQTGDVAGAAQQLAEIALLLAVTISARAE